MSFNMTISKTFNKFLTNLINDYNDHLLKNGIIISQEIQGSFFMEKPSKRKGKLSPYTVFMKEYRSKITKENPKLSFQDVSQILAEKWSQIKENPQKFQEYQERANNHNNDSINGKNKKMCEAKKGSDGKSCQVEAKQGSNFCGRHKKLAFDHVSSGEEIGVIDSDSDYLSCQHANCNNSAESGRFCKIHNIKNEKICIQEKYNGQICGKIVKNDTNYCGFHNPNKTPKKIIQEFLDETTSDIESNDSNNEVIMYYDSDMNVLSYPSNERESISFKIYNNEPIAYNSSGEEIGVLKDNKIQLFTD
jgi:hypothetical protein